MRTCVAPAPPSQLARVGERTAAAAGSACTCGASVPWPVQGGRPHLWTTTEPHKKPRNADAWPGQAVPPWQEVDRESSQQAQGEEAAAREPLLPPPRLAPTQGHLSHLGPPWEHMALQSAGHQRPALPAQAPSAEPQTRPLCLLPVPTGHPIPGCHVGGSGEGALCPRAAAAWQGGRDRTPRSGLRGGQAEPKPTLAGPGLRGWVGSVGAEGRPGGWEAHSGSWPGGQAVAAASRSPRR